MPKRRAHWAGIAALAFSFAVGAADAQYQARWDQVGGNWTTGWVDGNRPACIHGNGCACGGANYCGTYRNGNTTTAWPYSCARPNDTWQLRCTVRNARKFRARWDQVGGNWTTGWVVQNENACGHGYSCFCGGGPNLCGWYPNGTTTTVWPYSCKVPNVTWQIRCTVEEIPAGAMASAPRGRTFRNPMIGRYFVDRCLGYASNCDQPAADAYCRAQGFERARAFHWSYKYPTRVQEGGQVCNASTCGGFDYVRCEAGGESAAENYSAAPGYPSYTPVPAYPPAPAYPPQQQQQQPEHQSGGVIMDTPQN
jgi:hypothetical protein